MILGQRPRVCIAVIVRKVKLKVLHDLVSPRPASRPDAALHELFRELAFRDFFAERDHFLIVVALHLLGPPLKVLVSGREIPSEGLHAFDLGLRLH